MSVWLALWFLMGPAKPPFLPLKEQLTISPAPKRYKEGMNITFNVPTDKEEERLHTHTNMYI